MLQSSAYRQNRRPRRVNSLSRSSSMMLLKRGESGPPCGVPSSTGTTRPSSTTPALRNARMSLSTRLSDIRAATRAMRQGNRTSEQCEKPGEVGFIPSGAHELGAQGSFCGVLLHDVQRHVAQHGEIVRAVVETGSVLILVHDDIQPPV